MVYNASDVKTVAVVGFGTMGIGIAQNFAEGGLRVHVIDRDDAALTRGMDVMTSALALAEAEGLIPDADVVHARVTGFDWDSFDAALDGVQMVVETVPEVLDIKKDVFARLDRLPADVLIGSNTSSFTVSQMTADMDSAARVVGLHYFNPAHLIPAVEIHHGERTSDAAIDAVIGVMRAMGKVPVRVRKEIPGFIINRLTGALEREIDLLLDQGVVSPEDLDEAVKASLGFRLACIGPMEAEDFIGLDTAYRVSNNVFKGLSNATKASGGLGEKVERGELGVKSGKGWYDYSDRSNTEVFATRDRKLMGQLALYQGSISKGDAP